MASPPSHRTQDPRPAPPAADADLFAPLTPTEVGPGDPTVTRGTGRHARHRRSDAAPPEAAAPPPAPPVALPDVPPVALPDVLLDAGPDVPVVAPAWLPAQQAAHTPPAGTPAAGVPVPAVPVPVFEVPEVRVPTAPRPTSAAPEVDVREADVREADARKDPAPPDAPLPDDADSPRPSPRLTPAPRRDPDRTDPAPAPPRSAGPAATGGHPSPARPTENPLFSSTAPGLPQPAPAQPVRPAWADPGSVPPLAPRPDEARTGQVLPGPLPTGPGDPTVGHVPRPRLSATGTALPAARPAPSGPPRPMDASSARLPRVAPAGSSPAFAPARPDAPGPRSGATGSSGFPSVAPHRPGPPAPRPAPPGWPAPRPPADPRPGPRPDPLSELGPDARLGAGAPAGDRPLKRAARFAVHLVSTTRATRELAELAEAAQAPVTTGRRIAVVSVRGGAGRSTVTALLGSVFAARRGDHVLVADADPDHGSLAWRLGLREREPLPALAPRLLAARAVTELDALLPSTRGGLRMLPGAPGAPTATTRDVTRALSRFFAICVTDCARGLETPGTTELLHEAHAAVLVAPATPDGVRSTRAGLSRLPPALLSRVAVVLSTGDRGGRAALDLGAAHAALAGTGAPVVVLPYDRHLAAGTPIAPPRLAEATTIEATRLAGYALRCAAGARGGPP